MKTEHKEIELLEKALEALHKATGIDFTIEGRGIRDNHGRFIDAIVRLVKNGLDQRFVVEIKRRLTTATVGMVINQLNQFNQKGLIVTDYVNPNMADRLKEIDIPFIDIIGNAYINEPPIYVFVKGNRPLDDYDKKTMKLALDKPGRAFTTTGLKVLFALIIKPELLEAPYRDIAHAANVALGTVGWVLTDLRLGGFLVERGNRYRRLINKQKLINKWVEAYPQKLKPTLNYGRYNAEDPHWWKTTNMDKYEAYWGGEIAAVKLTEHLRPEKVTIYTKGNPEVLMALLVLKEKLKILNQKLKTAHEYNLEIIQAFWNVELDQGHHELVHPLLVYADLMGTGDPRNIETARIIYDKEIIRLIGED